MTPEKTDDTPSGIARAVAAAGSQENLADYLGCTQQAVSEWVRRGYVPASRAVEIEAQYGVPRIDLLSRKLRDLVSG